MKTDTTQKERRERFYAKRQREGFVRIQVWVPRAYRGELIAFATELRERFFKLWGSNDDASKVNH